MNLAAQIENRFHELSDKRRRVVVNGLNEFARELVEQSAAADNLERVEAASRVAVDIVEMLMTLRASQATRVAGFLAELRAQTDAEDMSDEALEASGRLQVLALYRAVEEESLSVAQLEEAGIQRQRLKQLRDQGRLLGIKFPFQRGFLYPRWQFGEDLRPRDFLPEVLAVAGEEGLDALTVHRLMTHPEAGGGISPLELCEQGRTELAVNALRSAGDLGG